MKKFIDIFAVVSAMAVIGIQGINGDEKRTGRGYVIERDSEVARAEPAPHKGPGRSTGFVFFDNVPDFKISFRKRVLHRGSAIGYHIQETDEVYYIVSGSGRMTINGEEFAVKPGDAILTRTGSSHGLVQEGRTDLTIIITYEKQQSKTAANKQGSGGTATVDQVAQKNAKALSGPEKLRAIKSWRISGKIITPPVSEGGAPVPKVELQPMPLSVVVKLPILSILFALLPCPSPFFCR